MTQSSMQETGIAPYLTVSDANAAIGFYQRAFGATETSRMPDPGSGKVMHASLEINGGIVMLSDDFPEMSGGTPNTPQAIGGSPVTIHLRLPLADVDTVWQRAVDAGATVTMPLEDRFWGDRYGEFTDPFGHRWSLGALKSTPTEEEMREALKNYSQA
ncbi:MAG: VOC family protein [Micromonosporaceae bacterium]